MLADVRGGLQMSDEAGGCLALLIAPAIIGAAACAYFGVFYPTGQQWYEACWAKQKASKDFAIPDAPDSKTAILWENCEPISKRAFFTNGIMFAPLPKSNNDNRGMRLQEACPSLWRDLPMGGTYMLSVRVMQQSGGPNLLDRFLPAEQTIAKFLKTKWPHCSATRIAQGYPEIVETKPGEFGWQAPCTVCDPPQ
jgi:hypothetical protein